jgi:cytochrome c biogenesis protein CcmG, thiol:disulfide interchange protein DsbE
MSWIRVLGRALKGVVAASLLLVSMLPGTALAEAPVSLLDLSEYRGKVVVIDFWASWCAPCRRSFPWFDAMQQKYGDEGLVVIGVNEDNDLEEAEAFLGDVPVSFRIVGDASGEIARAYDLVAMPSTYVIGRDGQVAARHLGFKTAEQEQYEALLRRLLDTRTSANDSDEQANSSKDKR